MVYPKWAVPNTSTVSDDPQNLVNRAKGNPSKAPAQAPTKMNHDGDTTVLTTGSLPPERMHSAPCINPSCKSYGRPHPNCLCYAGPGGTSLEGFFAHGGCVGEHKESCEHYADGGTIQENTMFQNDPQQAIDHVAVHHGLLGLLTKTGQSKSENEHKHFEDYVNHSRHGKKAVHGQVKNLFNNFHAEADKNHREALKNHLQDLREHPEKLLDVGGNLGDVLPDHGAALAAKSANAVNYFNVLRPKPAQTHPLDAMTPPDNRAEDKYDRQIDIAQNPMLVLQHVKDGTVLPADVNTVQTLYPSLYKSMVSKVGEALIEAKSKDQEIPYKQRITLSMFLQQPLDSTMTPQSMQAIMASSAQQQAQNQARKQGKASGVELKQINKVNSMDQTSLESRQIRKQKD